MSRRVLIIGGVAGGATCAARLRRLDESVEIHVFDRGSHVAFANCGLPYHVGDVIADEGRLLVASPELFRQRFNVGVHTRTEVLGIDRARQVVRVRSLDDGAEREEPYDALLLAPGASPIRPPLPGIDRPGVFTVRSIPDTRAIRAWMDARQARRALVVGGGFIGLEMVENLVHRGLEVSLITPQLMPPLDPELVEGLRLRLIEHGVRLHLPDQPVAFEGGAAGALQVRTQAGATLQTDLVILAIGVRPETALAQAAGLPLGERGGIVVDEQMRTADPKIWAVGDAVEVHNLVTGQEALLPLAGPAQRQARVAAESICGRPRAFRGVQATAVVSLFGMTAACTGANETALRRAGRTDFQVVRLHPGHHASYFPGARPIHLKLLFTVPEGRVLGAQAVGDEGVEKRIDVIATHMQHDGTVWDLAESELCYAPQFGAAKDPVNMAGMIAVNHLSGDLPLADWAALPTSAACVVDVREPHEYAAGRWPGAINAPLSTLRERWAELPRDRPLWLMCGVGQRAWYATRFLLSQGFDVALLSGGWVSAQALYPGLVERDAVG